MEDNQRATLWAVSDLHVSAPANRPRLADIVPAHPGDWLIVAGDVAERTEVVIDTLRQLRERFSEVIWVPGNHELFSTAHETHHGRAKYQHLVAHCRAIGVHTPEDEFPVFDGVTVAPLFTLYDYSFRPPGLTVREALDRAAANGIVMTDETAIAPYADIPAWCWDRLTYSVRRLSRVMGPTILVNHWPLVQEPTHFMQWADVALWTGTRHTRSWPQRFHAIAAVYGHLHMPGTINVEGVPHIEVSLGYPRQWQARRGDGGQPGAHAAAAQPWPYPVLREGECNRDWGRGEHA